MRHTKPTSENSRASPVPSLGPDPVVPARQEPSLLGTGCSPDRNDRRLGVETPAKKRREANYW